MTSSTPTAFDTAELWAQYGRTPDYLERRALILDLLPRDTESVLDVGCGDGDVLHAILDRHPSMELLGVDVAPQALEPVRTPVEVAGLPDIPRHDRSFDLVACLQVLEHIDDVGYAPALAELQRLARKYLIVGVPFAENLSTKKVVCAGCGQSSHTDGHVRTFDMRDMRKLFGDFALERAVLCGVVQPRRPRLATWLQHRVAGLYYSPGPGVFLCPHCGATSNVADVGGRPRAVRKAVSLVNRLLQRTERAKPYWVIALYRRTNA